MSIKKILAVLWICLVLGTCAYMIAGWSFVVGMFLYLAVLGSVVLAAATLVCPNE